MLKAGYRRGSDNMAALLGLKDRHDGDDAVEDAFEVDVDHGIPLIDAKVTHGRIGHDAGIIEDGVDPSELIHGGLYQTLDLVESGHIDGIISAFSA